MTTAFDIARREFIGDPDPVTLRLYGWHDVVLYIATQRRVAADWGLPYPIISVRRALAG